MPDCSRAIEKPEEACPQDGNNAPAAQNFKLVGWDKVKAALGIN